VDSFGVRVGIRVDDPALLSRVCTHMPPGFNPSDEEIVDLLYSIHGGGRVAGTNVSRFTMVYSRTT
jgi:hypothetical protein